MQFIPGKPALLYRDALVIGDLHIGLESELHRKGVRLPSQTQSMLKEILSLIKQTKAKKLFILGDLKHKITSVSQQESKDIPLFLSALNSKVDLRVVLGNHDSKLKPYLKDFEAFDSRGFLYHNVLFFHGHAKPLPSDVEKCTRMVASHWHPMFEFKNGPNEKVWVEAQAFGKPLLIMPSFNKLLGGVVLQRINDKWVDFDGAKITLLDGTYLGEFHV